jgi:hypothetical protein
MIGTATTRRSDGRPWSIYVLWLLSFVALLPAALSLSGIWTFSVTGNIEGLMVVGFMALYSVALLVPYLGALLFAWGGLTRRSLAISAAPFVSMLLLVIIATANGLPW